MKLDSELYQKLRDFQDEYNENVDRDERVSFRDDYSGRFMFGAETTAVVARSMGDVHAFLKYARDNDVIDHDEYSDIVEAVIGCKHHDDMGLSYVWY